MCSSLGYLRPIPAIYFPNSVLSDHFECLIWRCAFCEGVIHIQLPKQRTNHTHWNSPRTDIGSRSCQLHKLSSRLSPYFFLIAVLASLRASSGYGNRIRHYTKCLSWNRELRINSRSEKNETKKTPRSRKSNNLCTVVYEKDMECRSSGKVGQRNPALMSPSGNFASARMFNST
jgi:hypothetical protein